MKIAFMGAQAVGKSTLIKKFLQQWPMYKTPDVTYRDIIKKQKIKLNKKGDAKSQRTILNCLIDEIQNVHKDGNTNIVFDRCVVDNIAYTLWLHANGRVDEDFVTECKTLAAETLKLYDVVFYLPVHESIAVSEKNNRSVDLVYREEIDNIFKALVSSYEKSTGRFFPLSDCPAVITLDMAPDVRCEQIKLYINEAGVFYGEDTPSLIAPYMNS
jgi:thymidylate kinase